MKHVKASASVSSSLQPLSIISAKVSAMFLFIVVLSFLVFNHHVFCKLLAFIERLPKKSSINMIGRYFLVVKTFFIIFQIFIGNSISFWIGIRFPIKSVYLSFTDGMRSFSNSSGDKSMNRLSSVDGESELFAIQYGWVSM